MKNLKKISLFLLLIPVLSYSQESAIKSQSKAIEFSSRAGSFLQTDEYELTKVGSAGNKIEFSVYIFNDLKSGEKQGALFLTTSSWTIDSRRVGFIDFDEIDACIQCLEYIKSDVINNTPDHYSEALYKSRDGVIVGAYYNYFKDVVPQNRKWLLTVKVPLGETSRVKLPLTEFDALLNAFKEGKALIESKIKQ